MVNRRAVSVRCRPCGWRLGRPRHSWHCVQQPAGASGARHGARRRQRRAARRRDRGAVPWSGSATDDERLVATLTDAGGVYALTPNDTGRFVVTAKRIGVRRFQSPAIALARGQTHRLDITLEGVRFDLPVVTVSGATPCNTRWGTARASPRCGRRRAPRSPPASCSLRERLFRARITRYHRILEPRSLTVRHESRDVRQGVTEHAFESFAAESLAVHGYARMLPDGEIEYFAPDERVLLSGTFVRDCFALARDEGNGETGITFVPVRTRRVTDIEGTIWLDARSYELRRVTFRYTNFPMPLRDPRVGGEVQFTRLARGAVARLAVVHARAADGVAARRQRDGAHRSCRHRSPCPHGLRRGWRARDTRRGAVARRHWRSSTGAWSTAADAPRWPARG